MDRYLRVRAGRLQTSIRTWVHPGGRRATLVAMVHVGDLDYYQQVRQAIDSEEAAGAVVLCENYTLPETPPESNTDEAAAFGDLHRLMHLTRARAVEMGWTLQADAMIPAATWRQVDVDPLTLLRLTGIEPMRLRLYRMTAILDFDDRDRIAAAMYRIKTALWWRLAASRIGSRLTSPTDPTLLDRRNKGTLAAMDATNRDVIQVWGARHLPGLQHALRVRGYRPQVESWYTVCRLPSILRALSTSVCRRPSTANAAQGTASVGRDPTRGSVLTDTTNTDQAGTSRDDPHLIGDVPHGSSAVRARFPGQGGGSEPAN